MLKHFKKYYQKLKEKIFKIKVLKHIEIIEPYHKTLNTLPIANFDAIMRTNNLNYLYKKDFFEINLDKKIPIIFFSVLTEMIKEIKDVDNTKLRLEYQKELDKFKYLTTGNAEFLNKSRRKEIQLKQMQSVSSGSNDLMKEVAQLEKHLELKLAIDIYTCPTSKYLAYREMRKQQIEQLRHAG